MRPDSPLYITTKQLSQRWGVSERTLCRYRADPGHPLAFSYKRPGTEIHPTLGLGYRLADIERIERMGGAR